MRDVPEPGEEGGTWKTRGRHSRNLSNITHLCLTHGTLQLGNSATLLGGWDFPITHLWAATPLLHFFTGKFCVSCNAKEMGPGLTQGLTTCPSLRTVFYKRVSKEIQECRRKLRTEYKSLCRTKETMTQCSAPSVPGSMLPPWACSLLLQSQNALGAAWWLGCRGESLSSHALHCVYI